MSRSRTAPSGTRHGPRVCRDCGDPVHWWRNSRDTARWVLVGFSPDDKGTVQKVIGTDPDTGKRVPLALVLSGLDLAEAVADGRLLFPLHHTTCSARRRAEERSRT